MSVKCYLNIFVIEIRNLVKSLMIKKHILIQTFINEIKKKTFYLDVTYYITRNLRNHHFRVFVNRLKARWSFKETYPKDLVKITSFVFWRNDFTWFSSSHTREYIYLSSFGSSYHSEIIGWDQNKCWKNAVEMIIINATISIIRGTLWYFYQMFIFWFEKLIFQIRIFNKIPSWINSTLDKLRTTP